MPPIAYCTNVFPSDHFSDILHSVLPRMGQVRGALGWDTLGLGLHVPKDVLRELTPLRLNILRSTMKSQGLRCVTMNGFPYTNFHGAVVREAVYSPSWAEDARAQYTLELAELLADLAPEDHQGPLTISTVPIRFVGPGRANPREGELDRMAFVRLAAMAKRLQQIEQRTGRHIMLCLEPEPFTVMEDSADVIAWFHRLWNELEGMISRQKARSNVPDVATLKRHIGVCVDCCHQAVVYEGAAECIDRLINAGVPIGKVQISSAPELVAEAATLRDLRATPAFQLLASLDEQRYLHQAFIRYADVPAGLDLAPWRDWRPRLRNRDGRGPVVSFLDLGEALHEMTRRPFQSARSHFHLPVFASRFGELGTTQQDLQAAILLCQKRLPEVLLEVETYTWTVLPEALRSPRLEDDLAHELHWLHTTMTRPPVRL